jgi:hypothetical protein
MGDGERQLKSGIERGKLVSENMIEYFFDLRKNLQSEFLPDTVARILKPTIFAKKFQIKCLPNLKTF